MEYIAVHPRGCGESRRLRDDEAGARGPSPRVRGILDVPGRPLASLGSIPAGAGNPGGRRGAATRTRVHPRGCGESIIAAGHPRPAAGPSPRVRGIHHRAAQEPLRRGSIPAGAGNPIASGSQPSMSRVHPRGCGESQRANPLFALNMGPSPRVRGIRQVRRGRRRCPGSIPAGAGNPVACTRGGAVMRVHPRGCGESYPRLTTSSIRAGPSPRVRGIHRHGWSRAAGSGSIPAGAGNPRPTGRRDLRQRVHPRGCGESRSMPRGSWSSSGPSPRVRGILPLLGPQKVGRRSIPAGAGNPCRGPTRRAAARVHPRGCGESSGKPTAVAARRGPSPRVRGIRGRRAWRTVGLGSIPAGAGNPSSAAS